MSAGEVRLELLLPAEIRAADPYTGSRNRHLHLLRKRGPTPAGLPRRPGMAKKHPRGVI